MNGAYYFDLPIKKLYLKIFTALKKIILSLCTNVDYSLRISFLHNVKLLTSGSMSGATSEYPATHALLKSTATVVRGPQSAVCTKS